MFEEVNETDDNMRLDRWLKRRSPTLSYQQIQRMIRKGEIRIDSARAKAGQRLRPGMKIRIPRFLMIIDDPHTQQSDSLVTAYEQKRSIMFFKKSIVAEEADYFVIDKPAGLAVQGGTALAYHLDKILDHWSLFYQEKLQLVHRLDKATSGLLLIARSRKAAAVFASAFKEKKIEKTYLAIATNIPAMSFGVFDQDLTCNTRDGGMRVVDATTHFKVRDVNNELGTCLLELKPINGRKHQLRKHLSNAGYPILGDNRYGVDSSFFGKPPRLALHAWRLVLPKDVLHALDVDDAQKYLYKAPLDDVFQHMLQKCGLSKKLDS